MKLFLSQRVPAQYEKSAIQYLFQQVETQGNALAEGRLAGRHFNSSVVPTTGSFAAGDIVWHNAPTNTGPVGWINSSPGSPGTLRPFGQASGSIGSGRNMAAQTDASAPTTTINFTADEVLTRDTNGNELLLTNASVSAAVTASGVNGLDTGSEDSSTWYYGWVIAKPDGTAAGLLSESSSAPTMPTGYTYKALVSAVYNDGSSDFVAYRQKGSNVFYLASQAAVAAGTATTETEVTLTSLVPPIALEFFGNARATVAGAGVCGNAIEIMIVSGSAYTRVAEAYSVTGTSAGGTGAMWTAPNTGNFYYRNVQASSTSRSATISIVGFKLPMGAE